MPLRDYANFLSARLFGMGKDLRLFGLTFPKLDRVLWTQIFHIFFLGEYTPAGFEIDDGDTVIDIGANMGVFTAFASWKSAGRITAYEPESNNFRYIQRFAQRNNINNLEVKEEAVSSSSGAVRLYKSNKSTRHSLLGKEFALSVGFEDYEEVESVSLEQILMDHKSVDHLKIDCEGAEFDMFRAIPAAAFNQVEKMVIEYHDSLDSKNVESLLHCIREAGFKVSIVPNPFDRPYGLIFASSHTS